MIDFTLPKSNAISVLWATPVFTGNNSIRVKGRVAQTLCWLVAKGSKGITSVEVSSWALRLGAYIHILRSEYGLSITTLWEPHDGGQHGRYVLHTPVQILEVCESIKQ